MRSTAVVSLALALITAPLACAAPEPEPSGSVGEEAIIDAPPSPSFDTGDVIRRVRRSFVRAGADHFGASGAWKARIDETGTIAFSPRERVEAAPLRLEATVARFGLDPEPQLAAPPVVEPDGALALARAGYVERLRARDEGLEQTWSFDRAPAGSGDLLVRVHASGQRYLATTATGVHFADDASGLGALYSHAFWIGHEGGRTHIPARYDARTGAILLVVPAAVVDGSSYPAVLDPVVSPEVSVDSPIVGNPIGEQTNPSIAYGAGLFLVAWEDNRFDSSSDIIGARVSAAGAVLDPGGFGISPNFALNIFKDRWPSIAFDGAKFLVAFETAQFDPSYPDIAYQYVEPSTATLGLLSVGEFGAHAESIRPALVFDGTNYLCAWEELSGTSIVRYLGISPLLGFIWGPTTIPSAGGRQQAPAVTAGGGKFLVAWQDFRTNVQWDIFASRINSSGALLDAAGFPVSAGSPDEVAPTLASDGTAFLAAWADSRSGNADIYGTRIDQNGVVLVPGGIPISTATGRQTEPAAAWSGTRYLVAWHDERSDPYGNIYATTLTSAGGVLFPSGIAVSTATSEQSRVAVAWGSSCFRLAWDDLRTAPYRKIWSSCVTDAGSVLEPGGLFVGQAPNNELGPAISKGVSSYLVVWQDDRNGNWDIYGARFDSAMNPVGSAFAISTGAQGAQHPAVAFNGANWMVVWEDDRNGKADIYGARVNQLGIVLDPSGVVISAAASSQLDPDIAWEGSYALVAWTDYRNASGNKDIYAARVSGSMSVLEPSGIAIATGTTAQTEPAVGAMTGRFLVAWTTGDYPLAKVRAMRVASSGVLSPPEILVTQVPGSDFREADVDTDGRGFMVVSRKDVTAIVAVRVTTSGGVLDVTPVYTNFGDGGRPQIRFDGSRYLVTGDYQPGASWDVGAVRISTSATPLDASVTVIANSGDTEQAPTVAAMTSNQWMIAYQRRLTSERARLRTVTF